MTYLWKGEQYVAIGAGGHSEAGTSIGDSVVAFRLARPGEGPSLWSRTIDRPGGRFFAASAALALVFIALVIASLRWRAIVVSDEHNAASRARCERSFTRQVLLYES
jgi:quinoprotein glucose dehydrogenase